MPTPPPPVAEQDDARFRLAMASAGIGMAIVSLDGRWVDVNPALCRMFDRAAAELVGRRVHALSHPDDLPLTERLFERLHGGEVAALDAEKRYLRRDGTTIDVLLNTALMRAADGAPLYFISQFREVTAQRAAERELRELNETLEQRVRERTAGWKRSRTGCRTTCARRCARSTGSPRSSNGSPATRWMRRDANSSRASAMPARGWVA